MDDEKQIKRFHRILKILLHVQSGPQFNATRLAERFGVSRRTIYRDITFLRDSDIPVDFDEENEAYRLDEAHLSQVRTDADTENLAMLVLAAKISPLYSVKDIAARIDSAISELLNPLPGDLCEEMATLFNGFTADVKQATYVPKRPKVWMKVLTAIRERHQLRVRLRQGRKTIRTKIAPYQLVASEAGWDVVGKLADDRTSRKIKLNDILSAQVTRQEFHLPRGSRWRIKRSLATGELANATR